MSNKVLTKDELRAHLMQLSDEVNQKMKGDTAMNKRHKHADLIHAWAEGAKIQERVDANLEWLRAINPGWYEDWEYRIEPRTVKCEGWVAVYKHFNGVPHVYHKDSNGVSHLHDCIYASKDDVENECPSATDIIKIEWEEEE